MTRPTVSTLPLAPVVVTVRAAVSGYDYDLLRLEMKQLKQAHATLLLRYEAAVLRAEAAERALAEAAKETAEQRVLLLRANGHRVGCLCAFCCSAQAKLRDAADRREPRR